MAAFVFSFTTATASAADILVDDDLQECPAADYQQIQTAINASESGDTVVVCEGMYVEGSGNVGTNALTIDHSLVLKGAGADLVTISARAKTPAGGQIAAETPVLRDGVGNIVTVAGTPEAPISADISGVTITGGGRETKFVNTDIWDGEFEGGVYSEAGILFLDAGGSVSATRVTNIVTSERPGAEAQAGGYRSNNFGYGIAQVSAGTGLPEGTVRDLAIVGSRLDRYNKAGLLIDGATGDTPPLTPTGAVGDATVVASQVIGRNLNSPPNDGTGGGALLTTGTVFGQDGIRVTAGSTVDFNSGMISQNNMAGAGTDTPEQLPGSAGIRLIGAGPSAVTESNVLNNSYGAVNLTLDGTAANVAVPLDATDNFWGYSGAIGSTNTGPGVSPTTMPTRPTNPVNGAVDATFGSDAVHYMPYRAGSMADTDTGYWPVQDAPMPVVDNEPTVSLAIAPGTVAAGGEVELTATAADDFAIRKISFYDGAELIGSVKPPADSVAYTAPVVCGTRTLTVVVEDSTGQTASDDADLEIIDCPKPPDPPTAAPKIELIAAPTMIAQGGTKVSAEVTAEAGVQKVEFLLGTREVCELTAAPWECDIVPNGDEIGSQVLRAVVTDKEARTDQNSITTMVSKFDPAGLSLKNKRAGKKKAMIKIRGALRLPPRMSAAQGCAASRVTVTAKQGGKSLVNRQVALSANCGYKLGFKAKKTKKNRKKKIKLTVRFPGNESLTSITTKKNVR